MKFFARALVLGLIFFAGFAVADDTLPVGLQRREGIILSPKIGFDWERGTSLGSNDRFSLTGGISGEYFFTESFGIWLALNYTNRGFAFGPNSNTAGFVDVPFGISIRRIGDLFSDNSINFLRLGGFVGVPLANFSGSLSSVTFSQTSQPYLGLTLEGATVFPLNESFALGPVIWLDFGLANAVTNESIARWFFDYCVGIQATF